MKTIPIPPCSNFRKYSIQKFKKFIKHLRWKAYFYEHPFNTAANKNSGFIPSKILPQNEHFLPFEDDLYDIVRNTEFKSVKPECRKKIKSELKKHRSSKTFFLPIKQTTCMKCQKRTTKSYSM